MFSTLDSILDIGLQSQPIIMPIGISFFTFQGMSYVIDLYFKKTEVQKNPVFIAFYISFFPQLIAGPIVRYTDIAGQIYSRNETLEEFVAGVERFITGLAKKVIIANTVGYTADQIFGNPAIENTMATAWLGAICYSFQIFFDFSGYSDMAIGLAKMFGFNFLENFNYPYISSSISDFWHRWHISLSSWFRDYVYIPLGGNRVGNVYLNLSIVFILTGLWHGASFHFLAWGIWHGFFLLIERRINFNRKNKNAIFFPILWFVTMLIVVSGWVIFRSENLPYACQYLGVMFSLVHPKDVGYTIWYYLDTRVICMLIIAALASIPMKEFYFSRSLRKYFYLNILSCVMALLLFCISIVFVVSSSYNPFIYFRF